MAYLWPMLSDGDIANPGAWYVTAERDWEWVFNETDNTLWPFGNKQTPRQLADTLGRLWIHNPGGHDGPPMDLQQFSVLSDIAGQYPDDQDLQAKADWQSFVYYASRFSEVHRLAIYLGQPQSLKPLLGESAIEWRDRAINVIRPALDINPKPLIALDATVGDPYRPDDPVWSVLGGKYGGVSLLLQHLHSNGYETLVEPAVRIDAQWASEYGLIMTNEFRGRYPDRWYIKDDGKTIPLINPAEQSGRLVEYIRLTSNMPDEEKNTLITECHATGWDCSAICYQIPESCLQSSKI